MRKICTIGLLSLGLLSCSDKWEYKMVSVKDKEQEATKFGANKLEVTDESLSLFGKNGWELVDIFEKIELHTQTLVMPNMFLGFNLM